MINVNIIIMMIIMACSVIVVLLWLLSLFVLLLSVSLLSLLLVVSMSTSISMSIIIRIILVIIMSIINDVIMIIIIIIISSSMFIIKALLRLVGPEPDHLLLARRGQQPPHGRRVPRPWDEDEDLVRNLGQNIAPQRLIDASEMAGTSYMFAFLNYNYVL